MKIIVVGGGIAGIASSLLLGEKHQVTLIEHSDSIGGLLKSRRLGNGSDFDYGTHVPRRTGINKLDSVLFGGLDLTEWNEFDYLKVGNYFENHLSEDSQFINTELLGHDKNMQGLLQLLNAEVAEKEKISSLEYLKGTYGEIYTSNIFEPIMKKLYGEPLEKLHSYAHKLFGYSRLICGSELLTSRLKLVPVYDERLGHTVNRIGVSSNKSVYPKVQGIHQWISFLEGKLLENKIDILKEESIKTLAFNNRGNINKVILGSERILDCDLLVWSASPEILAKLLRGKEMPSMESNKHRAVGLFDFEFTSSFEVENHYIYCNDSNLKTFRITIYPNLTGSEINTCTVEVVGDFEEINKIKPSYILEELITMGIVSRDNTMLYSNKEVIKRGFPILKKDYYRNTEELEGKLISVLKNVMFVGRSNKSFFMEDITKEMYEKFLELDLIS